MDSAAHGVRRLVRLGRVRDLPRLEQRVEYVLRHRRPANAVLGAQGGLGDLEVDERPYTMRMRAPSSAKIRVHCIVHVCGGSRSLRSRRTSDPRGGARAPPRAREPRRIPDLPRGRRRARAGGGRARPPASPRGARRSSGPCRRPRSRPSAPPRSGSRRAARATRWPGGRRGAGSGRELMGRRTARRGSPAPRSRRGTARRCRGSAAGRRRRGRARRIRRAARASRSLPSG